MTLWVGNLLGDTPQFLGAFNEKAVFANVDINLVVRMPVPIDMAIGALHYVMPYVLGRQSAPPASPRVGDSYIVNSGSGAWSGQHERIATWNGASWDFVPPSNQQRIYNEGDNKTWKYSSIFPLGDWQVATNGPADGTADFNVHVKGIGEPRFVALGLYIIGEVVHELDLDVLIEATTMVNAGMSLDVFATPIISMDMSMFIKVPSLYHYMRIHKDLVTRYFGGKTSDAEFDATLGNVQGFDPPNPNRIETNTIGDFGHSFRKMVYRVPNTIPDALNYDKYSIPISSALTMNIVGFRCITDFTLRSFGPNSSIMFGMFNDQLDPFTSIASGNVCAFAIEAEKDHVEFRGWFGTSDSPKNIATGLPISRFIDNPLSVEIEMIDTGVIRTVEFRVFERDVDLDNPLVSFTLDTTVAPVVNTFSITSLGRRNASLPASVEPAVVDFEHVDIERGDGSLYDPTVATEIPVSEAKWRPYLDRPPFKLAKEGTNTISVVLSNDGVNATIPALDTIEVDTTDPTITVVAFEPESPVLDPFALNPPIVKGSLNPGFSGVSMRWYATHKGTWTIRVNSTGAVDGTELASGDYPTAGEVIETTWDFADLPQIDDVYDVTLYLIADSGKPTGKKLGIYIAPLLSSDLNLAVGETVQVASDLDMRIIS